MFPLLRNNQLWSLFIILSPFTKEFRGEGHSYESLNFSGATKVAVTLKILQAWGYDMYDIDSCSRWFFYKIRL